MLITRIHPAWSALVPALAAGLAGLRWLLQGSGNVYTDLAKQRYVPDPDFGWRLSSDGPIWLGLDSIALLSSVAIGLIAVSFIVLRLEKKRGTQWNWLRFLGYAAGPVCLIVPIIAFASGSGPQGARDALPESSVAVAPSAGVAGSLKAPRGKYRVLDHRGSFAVAKLSAGKEEFEARFVGAEGSLSFDPGDLKQPLQAEFSVDSASVDTGVELRSDHARDYLKAKEFPRISFALSSLAAAEQASDTEVRFRAAGEITLGDRTHQADVSGSLSVTDPAARKRLELDSDTALLVRASFELDISKTIVGNEDKTFDKDLIPLQISLVLVPATQKEPQ